MPNRPLPPLLLMALGLWISGCSLPFFAPKPPQVLSRTPTLDDVTATVNGNTARVRSLKVTGARVSSGIVPLPITTDIAIERPQRFRIMAGATLMGPLVDIGGNDQIYWAWFKSSPQPPSIYYCRQEQFAYSAARRLIPIEPQWLIEAFGLVTFSPHEQHQGPAPVGRGRLEIRTIRPTPNGPFTRLTVVDDRTGLVLEQHLYDPQGKLQLSALTSKYSKDEANGVWLPRQVDFNYPAMNASLKVSMDRVEVNTLGPADANLWQMPEYPGYAPLDVGDPNVRLNVPALGGLTPQRTQTRVVQRPGAVPGPQRYETLWRR